MDSETTSSMCPWSLSFQNVIDNAFKYWFNRSIYGCYWYFLQKSCPTLPLNPSPTGHWGGDHPRPRKLKVLPTQIHEDGIHFKSNVKLWRLFRSIVLPKKKKKERERDCTSLWSFVFSESFLSPRNTHCSVGFYLASGRGLKADLCNGYGDYCLPFSVKSCFQLVNVLSCLWHNFYLLFKIQSPSLVCVKCVSVCLWGVGWGGVDGLMLNHWDKQSELQTNKISFRAWSTKTKKLQSKHHQSQKVISKLVLT